MSRTSRGTLAWMVVGAAMLTHRGLAQTALAPDPMLSARDGYLAELGLTRPLAASIRWQLTRAQGETRRVLAEQLGVLYAAMLKADPQPDERQQLEQYCRELLAAVPEAATPALRLSLVVAQYLPVEDLVERRDLLLALPEEVTEAQRVLAEVTPLLERIARELAGRVSSLEDRVGRGSYSDEEMARLRAELGDARELRSEASFRAGWACLYGSMLSGENQPAARAMEHFGNILNAAPGRPATIDRAPLDLLKFDHIGKAAIGCALASAKLGNHVEALRWLSAIEQAEELSKDVSEQLLRRKLTVLAADDRWADIDLAILRKRRSEQDGKTVPLPLADARTLAVIALTSLKRPDFRDGLRPTAERMIQLAMGDLVARGEVGHVMSLVKSFGTAIIGTEGFINNYVRALRAFDETRELHRQKDSQNANGPTAIPEVVNAYRQAMGLFQGCLGAKDAAEHPTQRTQAQICLGLAQHYSGDLETAATTLETVYASQAPEAERRSALQYAIASLTLAIKGGSKQLEARKDRLEVLFIQTFPNTREANSMVLQRTSGGKTLAASDIESLLRVPAEDPLYHASRSVAADALYKIWKQPAAAAARDFAALRYADVAVELLKKEFAQATASTEPEARRTADVVVNRARRIAEVVLTCTAPDTARATEVLAMIDSVAKFHGVSLAKIEDELCYRRFQIAIATRDASADRELAHLRELGGPFVVAAERFVYRRALDEWTAAPGDMQAAERVVSSGSRVLLQKEMAANAIALVRDNTAAAARALWKAAGDAAMRDLALRLDREQLEKGFKTLAALKRIAEIEESLNHPEAASEAWLEMLGASEEDSDAWYEARYESIRLIGKFDQVRAASILAQFRSLRPQYGPDPWGERFTKLEGLVGLAPAGGGK